MDWVQEKLKGILNLDRRIWETSRRAIDRQSKEGTIVSDGVTYEHEEGCDLVAQHMLDNARKDRLQAITMLMKNVVFVNKDNQPLRFMKKLKLDPALLEHPLYH